MLPSWIALFLATAPSPAAGQQVSAPARLQPQVPDGVMRAADFATGYRLVQTQLAACKRAPRTPDDCFDLMLATASLAVRNDHAREGEAIAGEAHALALRLALPRGDVANARSVLASTLAAQGRYREAIPHIQAAFDIASTSFGAGDPRTFVILRGLASMLAQDGQRDKALAAYRQLTGMLDRNPGIDALTLGSIYSDYANLARESGAIDDAVDAAQKALDIWLRALPPAHRYIAFAQTSLGLAFWAQGRLDLAIPLLRTSLKHRQDNGAPAEDILVAHNNLGTALADAGGSEEAMEQFRQAVAIIKRHPIEDPLLVATVHQNLGRELARYQRYREAEAAYRTARAIRAERLGENHADTAHVTSQLATSIARQGRYAEARAFHVAAVSGLARGYGDRDPATIRARTNFGHFLFDRGEMAAARTLFIASGAAIVARLSEPAYSRDYAERIRDYQDNFTGQVQASWTLAGRFAR